MDTTTQFTSAQVYSGDDAGGYSTNYQNSYFNDSGNADLIVSYKVVGKKRLFYLDLKQNDYGRFLKISEKSKNGKKSTILVDEDDFIPMYEYMTQIMDEIKKTNNEHIPEVKEEIMEPVEEQVL
jgi:hypothetical protein